jgi:hypothetical protein
VSENYQERLRRFIEKYPFEYVLVWKVAEKFNEIYDYTYSISNFKGYGKREVRFNVENQSGSHKFKMNEEGMFFVGALSVTIVQTICNFLGSTDYEQRIGNKAREAVKEYVNRVNPYLLQNYKRCPKCDLDNEYKNKHCYECGTKLHEP